MSFNRTLALHKVKSKKRIIRSPHNTIITPSIKEVEKSIQIIDGIKDGVPSVDGEIVDEAMY